MFARSFLRSSGAIKRNVRNYATGPSTTTGFGAAGYAGIAAVAGAGGYYYYANVLQKAPAIPNVPTPNEIATKVPAVAAALSPEKKAFTGGDQGFLSLKLEKVEDISHNTKKFTFSLPEADQVSGLPIASALITKFKTAEMKKPVIRPYTPTSDTDKKGSIDLVVKKYDGGQMSTHMFNLKIGETLDIKGPIPKYPMAPNKHEHIAMIAGGTGITPMWQVANAIFQNPDDKTKVTLVFGNVSEQDILMKKEFEHLENMYPQRFRAFYVLDSPPEGWQQGKGFITKELLKTVLPEPKSENIKVFVCGPPGLSKAISGGKPSPSDQGELTGYLQELGYTKEQVFKF